MASTIIILGSSRRNGNTEAIVNKINKKLKADIINLLDFQISQYDYEHKNRDDDFLPLIRQIIDNYDYIIFATPVYWYAMSGMMKTFFINSARPFFYRKIIESQSYFNFQQTLLKHFQNS